MRLILPYKFYHGDSQSFFTEPHKDVLRFAKVKTQELCELKKLKLCETL